MRIAVTAGYGKSLHAVALIHRLAAAGHEVALALEVGLFSLGRVRFYLRQIGWRKLSHKVRARLFTSGGDAALSDEVKPMRELLAEAGIQSRTVAAACRAVGARHASVATLNCETSLSALRAVAPELVVYGGGGILRPPFFEIPRHGVLNAHGGPLPSFRGMNAGEWALLHGVIPSVVVTLIDAGVDTGPIVLERPIPPDCWQTIPRGRGVSTRVSVEALLAAVECIAKREIEPSPQRADAGRQFFVMAEPLLEITQRWIAEKRTPTIDPADFTFPVPPARGERS